MILIAGILLGIAFSRTKRKDRLVQWGLTAAADGNQFKTKVCLKCMTIS